MLWEDYKEAVRLLNSAENKKLGLEERLEAAVGLLGYILDSVPVKAERNYDLGDSEFEEEYS
jgi:hypothetical protein